MHEIEHVCLCCGAEKFNFYVPVQPAFFCFVLCSILRMQCTWILAHLYLCNWKAVLINFKLFGLHTVQQLCKCATILKIYIFYFYVRLTRLLLDFVIIISHFVCAYMLLNSYQCTLPLHAFKFLDSNWIKMHTIEYLHSYTYTDKCLKTHA